MNDKHYATSRSDEKIKPADKGNSITDTIQQRVTVYIERMFNDGYIDENTKKYRVQTNVKPGRFYILP